MSLGGLPEWKWTGLPALLNLKLRAAWYRPTAALGHSGELANTPLGRKKYLDYLAWLNEDEAAQKQMTFASMKAQTVATNRWLGENLNMGNLYEVSRKVKA